MIARGSRALALVAAIAGAAQAACAEATTPKEILDARAAMDRARRSPAADRARMDLYDAETTLALAEQELRDGRRLTRAHAYVAMRMADRARIAGLVDADEEAERRALAEASAIREHLSRRDEAMADRARRALAEQERREEAAGAMLRALDRARGDRGQILLEPPGIRLRLPTEALFRARTPDLMRGTEPRIRAIAEAILAGPPCFIWIQVVNDIDGRDMDARLLARRRAERIREALIAQGVPGEYFSACPEEIPASVREGVPIGAQVDLLIIGQPVRVPPVVIDR